MRGLINLVLSTLLAVGYSKESDVLKPIQPSGKMNDEKEPEVEPKTNSLQPYSFTSTVIFQADIKESDISCLGVLITLNHVLTDFYCSARMNFLLASGEMRFKSCPLTIAWVGTFYGLSNGYSTHIRSIHDESFLHGLSVVVLEREAKISLFISLAYIPTEIDHDDLCRTLTARPVYNKQNGRLEPFGMIPIYVGEGVIKAIPIDDKQDHVISLGGPLFYINKLIGIASIDNHKETREYFYKNILRHIQFINHWAPIQEHNASMHDPVIPIPYSDKEGWKPEVHDL